MKVAWRRLRDELPNGDGAELWVFCGEYVARGDWYDSGRWGFIETEDGESLTPESDTDANQVWWAPREPDVLPDPPTSGQAAVDDCPKAAIAGRRAPVQASRDRRGQIVKPQGTIAWEEHEEAWRAYDAKYDCGQSAERIAERHGFDWLEIVQLLGREPSTCLAGTGLLESAWGCR